MLSTLALAAALSLAAAQAGDLRISNDRATYGYLGPVRPDAKVLPGDVYFLMFDIEGLKVSDTGEVSYRMGMAVKNSQGKEQFKQEPIEQRALNSLGGTRVPAFAHATIGADTPPGEYVFEVTVIDPATKREATLRRKFQVEKMRFGIVRVGLADYPSGQSPMPYVAVPGQTVLVNFGVVGFERDPKSKQPNIQAEMRVLDESGKPTLPKPLTGEANKDVPEKWQGIPMQFMLSLNRPGKFKVQLKVTDLLAKKTAEQLFDVVVIEPK
ncbi:MAG TPA: hypothetical protein VNK04_01260 [Gemmataceae bacterium]|nr:hypothetical protein [Gemmataceae bacterium]